MSDTKEKLLSLIVFDKTDTNRMSIMVKSTNDGWLMVMKDGLKKMVVEEEVVSPGDNSMVGKFKSMCSSYLTAFSADDLSRVSIVANNAALNATIVNSIIKDTGFDLRLYAENADGQTVVSDMTNYDSFDEAVQRALEGVENYINSVVLA